MMVQFPSSSEISDQSISTTGNTGGKGDSNGSVCWTNSDPGSIFSKDVSFFFL